MWPLIKARGRELDYSLLNDKQINNMLPSSSLMDEGKSKKKMEELPIEILNGLLPKMHAQLRLLPSKHLKDKRLNLSVLSEAQLSRMFPTSFHEKDKSKKRFNALASVNRKHVRTIRKFEDF